MYVTHVIDLRTGARYNLGRILGAGATAEVYEGIPADGTFTAPVAVKVALADTPPEALAAFDMELQITTALAAQGGERFVPWVRRGQAPDAPTAYCLIMEQIPDHWQLNQFAAQANGRLPERLALQSGLAFARLLRILHQAQFTMHGDRKPTDCRWDEQEQRLVVIDWNRAAPIPAMTSTLVRNDLVLQDLRIFGQIWAELCLGRAVVKLPPVDTTEDAVWAQISRGLRSILTRALSQRTSEWYSSAHELERDLAEQQDAYYLFETGECEKLLEQAESIRDQADQALASVRPRLVETALNRCDLAARITNQGSGAERIARLQAWGESQHSVLGALLAQTIAHIGEALDLDQYKNAAQIIGVALRDLSDQGGSARPAILSLLRWNAITKTGQLGNEVGQDMADAVGLLRRIAGEIETAAPEAMGDSIAAQKLRQRRDDLSRLFESLPETVRTPLIPLTLEIEICSQLNYALRMRSLGRSAQVVESELLVCELWYQLNQTDDLYADHLRFVLPDLDAMLLHNLRDHEREQSADYYCRALQQVEADLQVLLQQPEPIWPGLSPYLATGWAALRAIGVFQTNPQNLTPEGVLDPQLTPTARRLHALGQITDLINQNQLLVAMQIAATIPADALLLAARKRLDILALARVEQFWHAMTHSSWIWPDQLEESEALLDATFQGCSQLDASGHLVADLKQLRADYQRMYTVIEPFLSAPPHLLAPDHTPAQQELDLILDEAEAKRIELVDRRTLPAGAEEPYRVSNLKRLRALRRTMTYHTEEIHKLSQRVQEVGLLLQDEAIRLGHSEVQMKELLAQYAEYRQDVSYQHLAREIVSFQQRSQEVDMLVAQARGITKNIKHIRQYLINLETTIHEYANRFDTVSTETSKIMSRFGVLSTETSEIMKAEQTIIQALYDTWCTLGMRAVLNIDLKQARYYYRCIDSWQQSSTVPPPRERLTLLGQAIAELDAVPQEYQQYVIAWHQALVDRDETQARLYARQLAAPIHQAPEKFTGQALDSIRAHHAALYGEEPPTLPPAPPQPDLLGDDDFDQTFTSEQIDNVVAWWRKFTENIDNQSDEDFTLYIDETLELLRANPAPLQAQLDELDELTSKARSFTSSQHEKTSSFAFLRQNKKGGKFYSQRRQAIDDVRKELRSLQDFLR